MLSNRLFKVVTGYNNTKLRVLNNGQPQGSAPLLFNLYVSDLPNTKSSKYMYADDIAQVTKEKIYEVCKVNQINDIEKLNQSFKKKNTSIKPLQDFQLFHLNNRQTS